jgi:RNA polymerase sigma-70 factor (ECF subfamily)
LIRGKPKRRNLRNPCFNWEKLSQAETVYTGDTDNAGSRDNGRIEDSSATGGKEATVGPGTILGEATERTVENPPVPPTPPAIVSRIAATVQTPLSRRGPWTLDRGGTGVGEPPQGRGSGTGGIAPDEDRNLSFEQIHRKYQDKIFNLILRLVGNREDAEDLTVDTFVNAYKHWHNFRGEARVSTWLHQIAVNNCKNRFKQRDRRREREPVSLDDTIETDSGELSREVADWSAAPERLLMDQEFAAKLQEAIDALPLEYRTVFVLAHFEDLSYEDIARITELTVPAVKTRLHRARNKVRQRLEPYYRGWMGRSG